MGNVSQKWGKFLIFSVPSAAGRVAGLPEGGVDSESMGPGARVVFDLRQADRGVSVSCRANGGE